MMSRGTRGPTQSWSAIWGNDCQDPGVIDVFADRGSRQTLTELLLETSMRVLLIVSEAPPIVSGVSRCVDRIVRGLQAQGASVDVLSSNDIRRWTFGEARISSFIGRWSAVSRDLDSYDVVNLHGPAPTMSDAFLALFHTRRSSRRPALVYTHHSSIDIEGLGALCRIYDAMTVRLASLADRVIVTTPSYAEMIRRPGSPPIDVIPWGVDRAALPGRERPASTGPLRVLFVGQLRPYKGVGVLIDAVAGQPDLRLTVAGDGPLAEEHLRHAARMGADNITFTGRISDEHLSRLYQEHDVIVLPSTTRAEAFGLVLLEGMIAGCVPVASDLPGVRDVAGRTGVLVPPRDEGALRDALLALAADRKWVDRLGEASRIAALSQPWDSVASAYMVAFEDAIHDVQVARWSRELRRAIRPPEQRLPKIAAKFDASWWSLQLFDGKGDDRPMAGWGRAAAQEFRRKPQDLAAHVARTGEPLLLDRDQSSSEIRSMLNRPDIQSAMAVPLEMRMARGVLSLTAAGNRRRKYTQHDLDSLVELVAS
jgi:glycosyltransferase involved in cell wall biosynthesis